MNNELQHYGVKGMRWGVRKVRERVGSSLAKIRRSRAVDSTIAKLRRKRRGDDPDAGSTSIKSRKPNSVKDMSDEELVNAINRLRLEKTYKDALAANGEVSKGKKYMNTILDKTVEGAAEGMKNAMRTAFDAAIKKYTGENDGIEKLKKATEELEFKARKARAEDELSSRDARKASEQKRREAEDLGADERKARSQDYFKNRDAANESQRKKQERENAQNDYMKADYEAKLNKMKKEQADSVSEETKSSGQAAVQTLLALPAPKDDD